MQAAIQLLRDINRLAFVVNYDIMTCCGEAMCRGVVTITMVVLSAWPGLPGMAQTGLFIGRVCFMHGWIHGLLTARE